MELIAPGWKDYTVIDTGDCLRLERLGDVVIVRQCAQAFWPRTLGPADWERAHASHFRHDVGPGTWSYRRPVPDSWVIPNGPVAYEMRLTDFGHIGLFAEQQTQWPWIASRLGPGLRAINLFAYTGGSTLAAASAGAHVTHVDAVKGVVSWARQNAVHSQLGEAPIRWIVDDAVKFVEREVRRGVQYDAVILDPPTFGRGPTGSVWKLEENLVPLLADCERLLSDTPKFVLLSAHTPGVAASSLRNLLGPLVQRRGGTLESGEMVQRAEASENLLPSGVYCRWTPN